MRAHAHQHPIDIGDLRRTQPEGVAHAGGTLLGADLEGLSLERESGRAATEKAGDDEAGEATGEQGVRHVILLSRDRTPGAVPV